MKPQRVIDFNKVSWSDYWYVNQEGCKRRTLPDKPTVHGMPVDWNRSAATHKDYPGETLAERARRLNIVDKWTPVCKFVVAANRQLYFFGEEAKRMYNNYKTHIFTKS